MSYRIFLWGTGERAQKFMESKFFDACSIVGFVDTYKKNEWFMGYKVYSPEELKGMISEADYLILVNQYFGENLELCMELGIEWKKIAITDNVCDSLYRNRFLLLREISEELFNLLEDRQIRLVKTNESDFKDKNRIVGTGKYSAPVYMEDYFRYRTFEFVAKEILKSDVKGEVAELGVFRGTFSSLMNEIFKEKKIYLFDTFEGFEEREAEKEIAMGRCNEKFISGHKDTSVSRMLSNLPFPEKSIVCQGFFPDSVTEAAACEKFAFVSLDVDFEESTFQGLKFFYPRLSEGGVIFVHDYNTFFLDGVRYAVERFEKESGIKLKKVPLADRAGSLVIIK